MLGRVKLDNTLLTCNQGNFNQITVWSQNQTLVAVVRNTCTTTVPPAHQHLSTKSHVYAAFASNITLSIRGLCLKIIGAYSLETLGAHQKMSWWAMLLLYCVLNVDDAIIDL